MGEASNREILAELNSIRQYLDSDQAAALRLTPRKTYPVCVDIIQECNLNCRFCLVFSPCAKKVPGYVMSIEQFEADTRRISQLFDEAEIPTFQLSGGEVLLHPDIHQFPYVIRKYFPKTVIRIVTNGMLLTKQSEEFWTACRETNAIIEQTRYPINLPFAEIKRTVESHGVGFIYIDGTDDAEIVCESKSFQRFPMDLSFVSDERLLNSSAHNEHDSRANFIKCWEANSCIILFAGRIYTCCRIPHIPLFNECFGMNLPVSERDSIDIYEAKIGGEILEFLATPVPFCRFCRPGKITEDAWRVSDVDIAEWADM